MFMCLLITEAVGHSAPWCCSKKCTYPLQDMELHGFLINCQVLADKGIC